MENNQQSRKVQIIGAIAQLFINNQGNRITAELANGMISEISKYIPEDPTPEPVKPEPVKPEPTKPTEDMNVDTTPADPGVTE